MSLNHITSIYTRPQHLLSYSLIQPFFLLLLKTMLLLSFPAPLLSRAHSSPTPFLSSFSKPIPSQTPIAAILRRSDRRTWAILRHHSSSQRLQPQKNSIYESCSAMEGSPGPPCHQEL